MGYSPWGCKEFDRTEQLSMHRLPYNTSVSLCFISTSSVSRTLLSTYVLQKYWLKEGRKEEVEGEELLFPFLWLNF